ncbi:MAG TPA: substrate-binding domain-containing protein [Bacillota bacterium]|nr:substrate-binding domain-containing protein [Bacillota bacterium]
MTNSRIKGSLALLFCLIWVTGCSWWSSPPAQSGKPVTIGLSMATLQEERWRRDRDYFYERVKQLGAELLVQNANNDSQQQLRQVEYLLNKQVDVLVIVPHDLRQAAQAVQTAKRAGVKVISYDRLIRNTALDLYISFDNIKVGELMAEYLVNRVPSGNYVIINGAPSDNNCYMFNRGYKNILQSYFNEGQVKLVFEAWADDWRPEAAYQYIQTLLSHGRTFNAVIAANDSLASAVIEALSEWRLAGKIPVVGHDADLSGCQRIVEGTQLMTVYKPIKKLAYRAADLAFALASGKTVKTNAPATFNGKHFILSEIISPVAIDQSSMDLIIKDGYHARESIYLNIRK